MAAPVFSIGVDLNLNLPGLVPILQTFLFNQGKIMADINELSDKITQLEASNQTLGAALTVEQGKTTNLVTIAGQTHQALVDLRAQVTPDMQPFMDRIDAIINSNALATATVVNTGDQVDAAAGADAP